MAFRGVDAWVRRRSLMEHAFVVRMVVIDHSR